MVVHIVVVDVTSFSPSAHSHVVLLSAGVGFRVHSTPSRVEQTSLNMIVIDMIAHDLLDRD